MRGYLYIKGWKEIDDFLFGDCDTKDEDKWEGYFPVDLRKRDNWKWIWEVKKCIRRKNVYIDIQSFESSDNRYDSDKIRKFNNRQEVMSYLESLPVLL